MPERTDSKAIECSCRLYQRLLKLYPKAHRAEYGAAMSQLFHDQCRDARAERRVWGLIRFWLRTLVDFVKTAVLEHLSTRRQIMNLLRPNFTPLPVFSRVFTVVFLFAFLASMAIAFLIPKSYRSDAQIRILQGGHGSQLITSPISPDYSHFLQTEFGVIQSDAVLRNVVKALNLCDVWSKKYNRGSALTIDRAETILRRKLGLQRVTNTRMVQISATSDDPDEAAELANGVAKAYRLFKARESLGAIESQVFVIQPAIPGEYGVRPDKVLVVTIGVAAGIMLGLLAGGVAAGFAERPKGNTNPAGASREAPSNSQVGLAETPWTNLAVWVVGSLWISLAVPFTVVILIGLSLSLWAKTTGRPVNVGFGEAVLFVLLGLAGALMSLAGISLLRGKLWARIYIGLAAMALPLWSTGAFRWIFVAFGALTLCALLLSPRQGNVRTEIREQPQGG